MALITSKEDGIDHDEEDIVWIPKVAKRNLVILTKDKEIRKDSLERRAVIAARAIFFTLGRAHRKEAEMVQIILHHRFTIERLARTRTPPVIAQINAGEVLVEQDEKLVKVKHARRAWAGR